MKDSGKYRYKVLTAKELAAAALALGYDTERRDNRHLLGSFLQVPERSLYRYLNEGDDMTPAPPAMADFLRIMLALHIAPETIVALRKKSIMSLADEYKPKRR